MGMGMGVIYNYRLLLISYFYYLMN